MFILFTQIRFLLWCSAIGFTKDFCYFLQHFLLKLFILLLQPFAHPLEDKSHKQGPPRNDKNKTLYPTFWLTSCVHSEELLSILSGLALAKSGWAKVWSETVHVTPLRRTLCLAANTAWLGLGQPRIEIPVATTRNSCCPT